MPPTPGHVTELMSVADALALAEQLPRKSRAVYQAARRAGKTPQEALDAVVSAAEVPNKAADV